MNFFRVNGSNFDPRADSIVVIPRDDCANPACSQASVTFGTWIECDSPLSSSTNLICGDGLTTGLPFQDESNDIGKICYCDGSARGGCTSIGDFNTDGNVVGGLSGVRTDAPTTPAPTTPPTMSPTTRHTCYASGDPHYQTFDGHLYDFQGQCEYVLARDCRPGNLTTVARFEVQGKNSPRPALPAHQVTWTDGVAVQLPSGDVFVFMVPGPGKMNQFNGGPLPPLPYTDGTDGTTVEMSTHLHPQYTITIPSLGAKIVWDGRTAVRITLDGTSPLRGSTCGLCADFNDNADDDFWIVDQNDHWRVTSNVTAGGVAMGALFPSGACAESVDAQHTRLCTGTARREARAFCDFFFDASTYGACHSAVDPQVHYDNCVFDHCNMSPELACSSYRLYEDLCATMDVGRELFSNPVVEPWSGSCFATEMPSASPTGNPTAIPTANPTGAPTTNPTVSPSTPAPTNQPTSSPTLAADVDFTCYASGDPHYSTFDGLTYNFHGDCQYLLAQCADTNFEVQTQNSPRPAAGAQVTYTYAVAVKLAGTSDVVELSRGHSGLFNGAAGLLAMLPYDDGAGNTITRDSSTGQVTVGCATAGTTVNFYRTGAVRLTAIGNSTLRNANKGLCGTFNGNMTNDTAHVALAGHWQTNPHSRPSIMGSAVPMSLFSNHATCNQSTVPATTSTCNATQRANATFFCARLLGSIYSDCQAVIDPQPFYDNCVFDHCVDPEQACAGYALYEDMCVEAGLFNRTLSVMNADGTCTLSKLTDGLGWPWGHSSTTCSPTPMPTPMPTQMPSPMPSTSTPTPMPTLMPTAAPVDPCANCSATQRCEQTCTNCAFPPPSGVFGSGTAGPTVAPQCGCTSRCVEASRSPSMSTASPTTMPSTSEPSTSEPTRMLTLMPATSLPSPSPTSDCAVALCGRDCAALGPACGWSKNKAACVDGGRTTSSEMTMGTCVGAVPTPSPTAGCSRFTCGLDCATDTTCGWSKNQDACVAGGRTTASEMSMGVCTTPSGPNCGAELCGLQCSRVAGCGWESGTNTCVPGARTNPLEMTLGPGCV
jgi:hypothetical protein